MILCLFFPGFWLRQVGGGGQVGFLGDGFHQCQFIAWACLKGLLGGFYKDLLRKILFFLRLSKAKIGS